MSESHGAAAGSQLRALVEGEARQRLVRAVLVAVALADGPLLVAREAVGVTVELIKTKKMAGRALLSRRSYFQGMGQVGAPQGSRIGVE